MIKRKALVLFFVILVSGNSSIFSKPGRDVYMPGRVLMFQSTPNPCHDRCLIRTYLPENDPFSSIRIMNSDSMLVKEISMSAEVGVSSAAFDVRDLKDGKYFYQLFYRGETRFTYTLIVKH